MEQYASKTFWSGVAERAIKTAAQAILAVITTGTVIWGLDWKQALGLAATAMLISVLTSIGDPRRTDTAITTGGGGWDDPTD
ncbi:holin [Schaalia sp. ZJ405]|uniref:holin n=1 Tax=Schaalia sp. ZJ405 TaxID=2709403 RepID=UPI0013EE372E|nr:holin [Schaalia sp. ZJ405]QPK81107.1 holin [Schaalia sp. ZJ405]